jgi:AcrR family transcriptional regulator
VSQEPKPRLDRDARREAILDVAREVFMDEGYAAASMSTIAARLGGSKGTLYNYFKSKDELFTAYVRRHCAWQEDAMFSLLDDGEDHRGALMRLARKYLSARSCSATSSSAWRRKAGFGWTTPSWPRTSSWPCARTG